MTPRAIAIFGGIFDPPHNGHVEVVKAILSTLPVDRVLVIVSGRPPHRDPPVASGADRIAMTKAAFADVLGAVVDAREVEQARRSDAPTWMIDTLSSISADQPGRPMILVVGADQAVALPSWHRFGELIAIADIAVVTRPDQVDAPLVAEAVECLRSAGARVHLCPMPAIEASSSTVRDCMEAGDDACRLRLLPDPVTAMLSSIYHPVPPVAGTS